MEERVTIGKIRRLIDRAAKAIRKQSARHARAMTPKTKADSADLILRLNYRIRHVSDALAEASGLRPSNFTLENRPDDQMVESEKVAREFLLLKKVVKEAE